MSVEARQQKLVQMRLWRKRQWSLWSEFLRDDSGIGVIELVLILVVLIGLVAIFKKQINQLLTTIFSKITSLSEQIY